MTDKEVENIMVSAQTKQPKDGWHTHHTYSIYIEDGRVKRAMTPDRQRPLYPYRASRYGGYDIDTDMTLAAFRAGMARGTVILH